MVVQEQAASSPALGRVDLKLGLNGDLDPAVLDLDLGLGQMKQVCIRPHTLCCTTSCCVPAYKGWRMLQLLVFSYAVPISVPESADKVPLTNAQMLLLLLQAEAQTRRGGTVLQRREGADKQEPEYSGPNLSKDMPDQADITSSEVRQILLAT